MSTDQFKTLSRRMFLTWTTASAAAFAIPQIVPAATLGRGGSVAPSERIVIAGIGLGGRGSSALSVMLG